MNAMTKTEERQPPQMVAFRAQLEQRLGSFAEALPPQITPQRFKSVVMQAVMAAPELLAADRVSLFESCLAAANDGLVPDKREGALVVYNTKLPKEKKTDPDVWIKKVQWLPMVRGILTKIYNTGKVKSASMDIVYGGDHFRYWKDDEGEHLEHEPAEDRDKNIMRRVYAHVVMKASEGGGVFAEVLDMDDVAKVRSKSKAKDSGPWADWFEEMAKKTPMKRLAKRLPFAREIQQVLDRDNALYDLERQPDTRRRSGSLAQQLDELADGGRGNLIEHNSQVPMDQETGAGAGDKVTASDKKSASAQPPADAERRDERPASASRQAPEGESSGATNSELTVEEARKAGATAREDGRSRKAVPAKFKANEQLLEGYLAGFDGDPEDNGDVDESEPDEEGDRQ
ncbi:recombinase RecT [Mesorhizobium sp.]|uniref:recombinase RecT n=1 Tax=Mesorhizobium sp. TaxID=1871066 RepID=UPI0025D3DA30|nr:recombinase RecT [Mesorhizobium sp.]